jgi:hypothetical protein
MGKPTWAGAIRSAADAERVLADVNAAGVGRNTTGTLARAVHRADEVELRLDATRLLGIDDRLAPLLPWPGIPRGSTIGVVGSMSLLMLLLASATEHGFAAAVGMSAFGALAAAELGVTTSRLALVPSPGPDWPQVVATLIDGVALVAVEVAGPVADGTVRSLQARAREKGCILVPTTRWPAANVTLEVTGRRWEGLGQGSGRLRRQHLEVCASGRGAAARPRKATVTIGGPAWPLPLADRSAKACDAAVERAAAAQNYTKPARAPIDELVPGPDVWAELARHLPRIERKRPWH